MLTHKNILITAGPTHEAIDPVRYLSNRSSGKMGYALAAACAKQGANVTLISGPCKLPTPTLVKRIDVISAQDMYTVVMAHLPGCDLFISAAAVADYRPKTIAPQKIKKKEDTIQLTLVKNPDILLAVSKQTPRPLLVGFAAETENLIENARKKMQEKNLEAIIANQVGDHLAFDQDDNQISVLFPNKPTQHFPTQLKTTLSEKMIILLGQHFFL
jgi:phosphopantothenoylcysteine decarboxylase / phosphopantothenate---cysteine ligase